MERHNSIHVLFVKAAKHGGAPRVTERGVDQGLADDLSASHRVAACVQLARTPDQGEPACARKPTPTPAVNLRVDIDCLAQGLLVCNKTHPSRLKRPRCDTNGRSETEATVTTKRTGARWRARPRARAADDLSAEGSVEQHHQVLTPVAVCNASYIHICLYRHF